MVPHRVYAALVSYENEVKDFFKQYVGGFAFR
jgi:hypothetical protein